MPEPHVHSPRIARAQAMAKLEGALAVRAAEVVCRHERLAAQARPEPRSPHVNMANPHRGIERRHQAVAVPAVPPRLATVAEALVHTIALQLGCEADEADDTLATLRARAFAENNTVAESAHEVVSRKLELG